MYVFIGGTSYTIDCLAFPHGFSRWLRILCDIFWCKTGLIAFVRSVGSERTAAEHETAKDGRNTRRGADCSHPACTEEEWAQKRAHIQPFAFAPWHATRRRS